MIENSQIDFRGPLTLVPPRRPLVWATTALAVGIVLDNFIGVELSIWLTFLLFCFAISLVTTIRQSSPLFASISVLLLILAVGGTRHHFFSQVRSETNIRRYTEVESNPARIVGVISSSIEIFESERGPRIPPWMEIDTSRFNVRCERLANGPDSVPISGLLRATVNGHLVHARIGDRVELLGDLSAPGPVKNPGGFDFKNYLDRQGVDALIRVTHPQAVTLLNDSGRWRWMIPRFREAIREEIRSVFVRHLSKESKTIALSILLGDRSQLNDEMRDRFAESGTMHLLAISGLHVGILAGLLAVACRLLNCSPRTTATALIFVIVLYATITNHRPPVLRATMLISVIVLGTLGSRRIDGFHVLAFCAGVLLLWKPSDLFDIGAQLSFLAVGAILWGTSALQFDPFKKKTEGMPVSEGWRFVEPFRPVGSFLFRGYVVTAAIWFATLPLTISTFQLVAPIGFALNILLIPWVAVILALGYVMILFGLLIPQSVWIVAGGFDWTVQVLLNVVGWAHDLPFGHFFSLGIPVWWLVGFYLLLAIVWRLYGSNSMNRWSWYALLIWIVVGVSLGSIPTRQAELRFTMLSVGHGLATVIELPSGETILYDAGTFGNGRRAERTVEQYLSSRRITRIDAVIVSHADHDHFSGLFGLLDRFPVATMIITQPFLDFQQRSVKDLCEAASEYKIPLHIVSAGDEISTSQRKAIDVVRMAVLHPDSNFHSKHDNANSIVLAIEYAGRRLLLTGDLEKDGLDAMLSQPAEVFDVAMAPHHGSKYSNPQAVVDWSSAKHVLVSSGDRNVVARLQGEVGPERKVLCTENSGAITVEVSGDGQLRVEEFLSGER